LPALRKELSRIIVRNREQSALYRNRTDASKIGPRRHQISSASCKAVTNANGGAFCLGEEEAWMKARRLVVAGIGATYRFAVDR
jgi:hypothetical protein